MMVLGASNRCDDQQHFNHLVLCVSKSYPMKRYLAMLLLSSRLLAIRFSSLTVRNSAVLHLSAVSHLKHAIGSEQLQYHIRLARMEDIPAISKCNIDNLPENYGHHYYTSHLARWPELSYIVESEKKEMV